MTRACVGLRVCCACLDSPRLHARARVRVCVRQTICDDIRPTAKTDGQVSIDYIIKLIESDENVESYIGMPADLRTATIQS